MSATYALLTHFPGPLMPNTHKDKVSLSISALHTPTLAFMLISHPALQDCPHAALDKLSL